MEVDEDSASMAFIFLGVWDTILIGAVKIVVL
jgi:hypothetical protein